jgi:Barstar (barnase inhibitor)
MGTAPGSGAARGVPVTERLASVVRGTREPGVYRWRSRAHPAALRRELAAAGWALHPVDGRRVTGAGEVFDALARTLAFPTRFRPGWDALADGLLDLSWLAGRGHVLLWDRYGALARADARAWERAHGVCAAAASARRRYNAPPLYVLLRGAGPADPPLL